MLTPPPRSQTNARSSAAIFLVARVAANSTGGEPPCLFGVRGVASPARRPAHGGRLVLIPDVSSGHGFERRSMLGLLRTNGRGTMKTGNEIRAVTAQRRPWNKGKLI